MVTITAKLVVDLGNSETRVKTICGRNQRGNPKSRLTVLDNRYAPVPMEKLSLFLESDNYTYNNSSLFKLDNDTYYCNGALCEMEMSEVSIRPTAMEKKYSSLISKITLINAFKQGFYDVCRLTDTPIRDLNIDWELYLLLPPEDLANGAKIMAEKAKEITSINFLIPLLEKPIRIQKVMVYPEGLCAFFGVVYERKSVIRPDYRYLVEPQESTIVFDIGAGTSDIILVKGGKVVQNSRYTREIGGNNVHRRVQRDLRTDGIALPDSVIREGVNTGYVKSGSRTINIANYIAEAKKAVSYQLVDSVQEFFESSMISVRTISNILVCGGGAEPSTNENIKPISDYIVEYMTKLSPDIKLVEMPTIRKNDEYVKLSPRLLNITGAGILAE